MRLHALLIIVLLAIIYEHQCEEVPDTSGTDVAKNDKADKVSGENYEVKDKKKESKKKSSRKDDEVGSAENKPSKSKDDDDDAKPIKKQSKRRRKKPDSLGYMYVYLKDRTKGSKKKKLRRIRFPVARYDRRRFPRFGSLVNFLPWLPIYVERHTKQTIIYSPAGGVYLLPPVVNVYGKVYSVGELLASGYASLVSTGAPPKPAVDVAPLVQTGTVVGPSVPTINPTTGGFSGAVRTDLQSFGTPATKYQQ